MKLTLICNDHCIICIGLWFHLSDGTDIDLWRHLSATELTSEMTILSGGAFINSTHSLSHLIVCICRHIAVLAFQVAWCDWDKFCSFGSLLCLRDDLICVRWGRGRRNEFKSGGTFFVAPLRSLFWLYRLQVQLVVRWALSWWAIQFGWQYNFLFAGVHRIIPYHTMLDHSTR